MRCIGLMSGTSMDGVDGALIETDGTPCSLQSLSHVSLDYPDDFKQALKQAEAEIHAASGDLTMAKKTLAEKHRLNLDHIIEQSTDYHIDCVKRLIEKTGAKKIDLIGYHGQTFYHNPAQKISIILGNARRLQETLGIQVVYDFRSNDIAHGGQGAPLAPIYHLALATRDKQLPLAFVNCGGISNVTLIPNDNPEDMMAYDTGPGNALLDQLVKIRTHNTFHCDLDGQFGSQGKTDDAVLTALFKRCIIKNGQNYFDLSAPKSLDYNDMLLIPELDTLSLENACHTLETFTAKSILHNINPKTAPPNWILSGGGWKNPVILNAFKTSLNKTLGNKATAKLSDEHQWQSAAIEAETFAYLAARSFKQLPISFPGTTGVNKTLSGGMTQSFHNL
jgi:anhydro-N-acetylmuramic acid kinase